MYICLNDNPSTDHSSDHGMLSLQGPRSREILNKICDADFSNEAFPFSTHKLVKIGNHEVHTLLYHCPAHKFYFFL